MSIHCLAERKRILDFYLAIASNDIGRIYEKYNDYKDDLELIRELSLDEEKKIDEIYRKRVK